MTILTNISRDMRARIGWLLCALVLLAYLFLLQPALVDDAFITLRYVKTLSTTGMWAFYPGYVSNTATSPLNVLLLSAVSLVTRSPYDAVVWLTWVELGVLAVFLRRIAKALGLPLFFWLAFLGLICNPLLMSTLGLESVLLTALLVAGLYGLVCKRWHVFAVASALLTLTRADGVLFMAVGVVALPDMRTRGRAIGLYALCLLPWYLYSWIALGSVLPDTFLYKVTQSWGNISFGDGLRLYARRYPLEVALTFLYAPLALLALLKQVRAVGAVVGVLFGYGILHYAAYTLLHVPPYHWYYVPEVACLVLLGALAVAKLVQTAEGGNAQRVWRAVAGAMATVAVGGVFILFARNGVPLQQAWIHTNVGTHAEYQAVGEWLKQHEQGKTGGVGTEIGTIAYYCDCVMREQFGDRSWVTNYVQASRRKDSLLALVARVNYLFYQPQRALPASTYRLIYSQTPVDSGATGQQWVIESHWQKPTHILFKSP